MIELLQYDFMRNALIAALLASIVCGIVGVYVVVKRIVFISGGIAQAAFGGIGLGNFLGVDPIRSVIPFSIASALCMGICWEADKNTGRYCDRHFMGDGYGYWYYTHRIDTGICARPVWLSVR